VLGKWSNRNGGGERLWNCQYLQGSRLGRFGGIATERWGAVCIMMGEIRERGGLTRKPRAYPEPRRDKAVNLISKL